MLKSLLILSFLYLTGGLATVLVYEEPDVYKKINNFLQESVDPKGNKLGFDEAKSWLGALKQVDSPQKKLVEALEQLVSLQNALDEELKCSKRSYNILHRNQLAIGYDPTTCLAPSTVVGKIVHHFSEIHATACAQEYSKLFQTKEYEISKKQFPAIELTDSIAGSLMGAQCDSTCADMYLPNFVKSTYVRAIYESMIKQAREVQDDFHVNLTRRLDEPTPEANCSVDGKKLDYGIKNFIVEPCEYLVSQLSGLFLPIAIDFGCMASKRIIPIDFQVGKGLGSFRICNWLLEKGLHLDKELHEHAAKCI